MGESNKKRLIKTLLTVFMVLLSATMILPFVWMISASFKPDNEVFEFPIRWIPKTFTFANYAKVWFSRNFPFYTFFYNSVKVTSLSLIGEVLTSALAGYAFAKIKFRGRDVAFIIYISTLIFPTQMMLIPRFVMFREMGIYNTHWALILPGAFTAFGTFMLKQYFSTIPEELSDSARIDGAGHMMILTRIIIPLSTAAISALIIFQFVSSWNQFEAPLVYLREKKLATIPLGLTYLKDENATSYAATMAASVCSLIPIFIVFFTFQKQFVQGIATSGLKE